MRPRIDPPPRFLLEADYYRLAYQLAAQRVNHAALSGEEGPLKLEVAAVAAAPVTVAIEEVERLGARVQQALDYLAAIAAASTWPWYERLSDKEQRLERFLISTVRPAVALIQATLELRRDPARAAAIVGALFDRGGGAVVTWSGVLRHAAVTTVPWSHRAYYNLAWLRDGARRTRAPLVHDAQPAAGGDRSRAGAHP